MDQSFMFTWAASSGLPDAPELGRRLRIVCRMCDERVRNLTPPQRDELLQIYIAQGLGMAGRAEATRKLCNMAAAIAQARRHTLDQGKAGS